jgi:hypothetical protein
MLYPIDNVTGGTPHTVSKSLVVQYSAESDSGDNCTEPGKAHTA